MVDYDLLVPYGWTEAVAEHYRSLLSDDGLPARIVRVDRGECDVATTHGLIRAHWSQSDSALRGLCTGDWVIVDESSQIRRILPRWSSIVRSTAARTAQGQTLAANVDTVVICTAADGDIDLARIERMLTLTWESDAQPVVVLTKADQADDVPLDEVRATAPGASVLAVSATEGTGVDVLAAMLDGTVALIGPSGAGKSTLANTLLGEDTFATDTVREVDKKGRHTTAHRELRPLPGSGTLIDTPGLRGVGLVDATGGIEKTFSDLETIAEECYFRDCAHRSEPGCAVRKAIDRGELSERRLNSYRKLVRENEWQASRTDKRLQAERNRSWRTIGKQQREYYRDRSQRGRRR